MMAFSEERAQSILNFDTDDFDVEAVDVLVKYLYQGVPGSREQKLAEKYLNEFQGHQQAWKRVLRILEQSQTNETKYFALHILQNFIATQWKVMPAQEAEGVKNFVVRKVIDLSSSFESIEQNKVLLSKLNNVLVSIVKQEWPEKWQSFLPDIVGASKTSEALCQNNMEILRLLSEDVFDFSKGKMVQTKVQHLKDTLCRDFGPIFDLCQFVLNNSAVPSLINSTLETLLQFLSWIPVGYIFETDLIPKLVAPTSPPNVPLLEVPQFRTATLACLAEIAALPEDPSVGEEAAQSIRAKQVEMLRMTMDILIRILPTTVDLRSVWPNSSDDEQNFVRTLALFTSSWLKEHGQLLESDPSHQALLQAALEYLIMMSSIGDKEIFKICLEYWSALASSLFNERSTMKGMGGLMLGNQGTGRHDLYAPILSKLRYVMVSNMAKPEEVLVVENEFGEVVREHVKDTDTIDLYRSMRITLVYLTHLDHEDTERIMTGKLQKQVDGSEWSWHNLNTLCWAIGSISGAMSVDHEKRFLVTVIKDLLGLCEVKRGKDHKAIIASNIMYIVGQYPRFLKAHWKFLKTVVNKLFEFMHESHEGVQDMACDTFIKIASKCKSQFVNVQVGEVVPFIEEIIAEMPATTCDLTPQQIHTFYEAVGMMISAEADVDMRNKLIQKLMYNANNHWSNIIVRAAQSPAILADIDTVRLLSNILKSNTSACRSIGNAFESQLRIIYMDMLHLYRAMSSNIQGFIREQGQVATMQAVFKAMRSVKKEILKLIGTWVGKSEDPEQVMNHYVPPLLEAVLGDYQSSIPEARDHEVLSTMAVIVRTLRLTIAPAVLDIFAAVFESTLEMINKDFESFPEHRTSFYNLLHMIVVHCFAAVGNLNQEQLQMVINAIVWGFKHPMRNVADTALKILRDLLDRMAKSDMRDAFYGAFFMDILQHLLSVVTDSAHLAGLNLHSTILAHMFYIVEKNAEEGISQSLPGKDYLRGAIMDLLHQAFPHLKREQLEVIVEGFFTYDHDIVQFKMHLRDFLVQCKEVVGEDLSGLYLHERKEQLMAAEGEKRQHFAAIPGMMNPHDDDAAIEDD